MPSGTRPGDNDPLRVVIVRLAALGEYIAYLAAARADRARVRARNIALAAFAGLVGLIIGLTVILSFWLYLLGGAAGGLSAAFGNRPWLGNLLAGGLGLAMVSTATFIVVKRMRAAQRRARIRKYEERKAKQRVRYGRDVEQDGRDAA